MSVDCVELFPKHAKDLLESRGTAFVSEIGIDIIRGIILDVLMGKNLRDSTEILTRKKIAILNAALLISLLKGKSCNPDFINQTITSSCQKLQTRLSKEERWICEWMLGINEKGFQNILRDNPENLNLYTDNFLQIMREVVDVCVHEYGALTGNIELHSTSSINADVDWSFILHLLTGVGAQTLAIRGSDKSTYGKLFGKLILGSLLHILGFKFVNMQDIHGKSVRKVFWLESRERRESDATLLYEAGKGIRFDIGFIGRGNSEISLDKVSRFEREVELGRKKWYLATVIIVDRIGPRSTICKLAERIDGTIIQMSMSLWPKEIARILKTSLGYKHEILNIADSKMETFLSKKIQNVPLNQFIKYI